MTCKVCNSLKNPVKVGGTKYSYGSMVGFELFACPDCGSVSINPTHLTPVREARISKQEAECYAKHSWSKSSDLKKQTEENRQ